VGWRRSARDTVVASDSFDRFRVSGLLQGMELLKELVEPYSRHHHVHHAHGLVGTQVVERVGYPGWDRGVVTRPEFDHLVTELDRENAV
jgi:hypothetical protein